MNKGTIKVVKRNKKDGTGKSQIVVTASKAESNTKLKIANVVNNWISERRDNSRAEKVFSDSEILGWKISQKNFE